MGKSKTYTVRTLDGQEYPLSREGVMSINVAQLRESADRLEVVGLALAKLRSSIVEEASGLEASWKGSFAPPANTRMLACSQRLYNLLETQLPSIIVNARDIATLVESYQRGG